MKTVAMLILMSLCLVLNGLEVPFSTVLVKTDANRMSGMERISPADKQPLDLSTDCWLWHDGKYLYAWWEMEIDTDFIPGAFATRDDNQNSDFVRLQIKTIANEDFSYYFSAYPRGTAFDGVRGENMGVDKAWNSLYECTSEYTDKSWNVLMKIPFRDLRFEGTPPYNWTFSLARQVQSTVSSYGNPFTPVTGRTTRQYFDSFAHLTIKETIENPKNYYVIPYFYRSYDMLTKEQSWDPKHLGLNVVYRPTSNSSVKLAFNPDFTETPVDEERDSHNDKYPPTLQENRIFFTEDLNAFGVGESQFYSRNIMQPSYAVKFTASGSNWNLGMLSAKDKQTEENGAVINPADDFNLLAFKPRFGKFSNQMTVLSRTNTEDKNYNYLFYSAPSYEFSPSWGLSSSLALSADKQNTDKFTYGHMALVTSSQNLGGIISTLRLRSITKDYAPRMATAYDLYNVDLYGGDMNLGYEKYFRNSLLRTLSVGSYSGLTVERGGTNQIRNYNANGNINLTFTPQFSFSANAGMGADRMTANNKLLNFSDASANLNLHRWRLCSGYAGAGINQSVLYSLIDPQKSYQNVYLYGGINGFLGPVISYIFRNNHIIWKELPSAAEYLSGVQGDKEYDITNLDMELTFTNNLKLVMGVRYNNYERYGFSQHVGYFCTMHYLVNASTKLYAGFKSTEDEYLETIYKTSETAWLKISKTF